MTVRWLGNINKARDPGKRALGTARLTPNERKIVRNFREAITDTVSNVNTAALSDAYRAGNFGNAVASFDWGQFGYRMSENRSALLSQINSTGAAEAQNIGKLVGRYAFDVTDQRAVSWAAARSGELIVNLSTQLQSEVRGIITNAFVNQITPDEVARELSRKVGLFPRWSDAVEKQYQRNLASFIDDGYGRRDATRMAGQLADAYRDRLINARAINIARTEIMTAANEGRRISWLQASDRGLIDLNNSSKEWIAEDDACDICLEAVDGGLVGVMDTFPNGEDMPPAHPSCRCTAVLVPEPPTSS